MALCRAGMERRGTPGHSATSAALAVLLSCVCLAANAADDVFLWSSTTNTMDAARNQTWLPLYSSQPSVFTFTAPPDMVNVNVNNPAINLTGLSQLNPQIYLHATILPTGGAFSFPLPSGRYWLRLHVVTLSNFPTKFPQWNATFSVIAGVSTSRNVTLLQDYNPNVANASEPAPQLHEFSVELAAGTAALTLFYVPAPGSYALLNAIEVVRWVDAYYGATVPEGMATETVERVNCGGSLTGLKSDVASRTWAADNLIYQPLYEGVEQPSPYYIVGTGKAPAYLPLTVYIDARAVTPAKESSGTALSYQYSVQPGWPYLVRLHFAEWMNNTRGWRVQDIFVNNVLQIAGFDIFATAGFQRAVFVDILYYLPRNESGLVVSLFPASTSQLQQPWLNGLEIIKLGTGPAGATDNLQTAPPSPAAVALLELAAAVSPAVSAGWTGPDPCLGPNGRSTWPSVFCDGSHADTVIGLDLSSTGLKGALPGAPLANLTSLQHLWLSNNALSGPLPAELGLLTNLVQLKLSNNSFSGSVPTALGNLTDLQTLWLDGNNLQGALPAALLDSPALQDVRLQPGNRGLCAPANTTELRGLSECGPNGLAAGAGGGSRGGGSADWGAIVGGLVGGAALLVLLAGGLAYWFVYKRKRGYGLGLYQTRGEIPLMVSPEAPAAKEPRAKGGASAPTPGAAAKHHKEEKLGEKLAIPSPRGAAGVAGADRLFGLKDLRKATANFSERNVIGRGTFGTVYNGQLPSGELVAIKRRDPDVSPQEIESLGRELFFISKIRHRDLVCLLGYCVEKRAGAPPELLLVTEYMENKTLRYWIVEAPQTLSWSERLKVVIGAARGLRYLHAGLQPPVVHLDVKTTNIFLDGQYNGRLADFCISRGPKENYPYSAFGGSNSAFVDPEFAKKKRLTEKSDVYSFGVVLLEVITGQPNLVDYAKPKLRDGSFLDLVDKTLRGRFNQGSVKAVADLTLACLAEAGTQRPSTDHVLRALLAALRLEEGDAYQGPPLQTTTSVEPGKLV